MNTITTLKVMFRDEGILEYVVGNALEGEWVKKLNTVSSMILAYLFFLLINWIGAFWAFPVFSI